MASVELDESDWQQVISILATAPWHTANPLLMKIGEQLRKPPHANDTQFVPSDTTEGIVKDRPKKQ